MKDNEYICEFCGCKLIKEEAFQPDCTREKYLCNDCWKDTGYSFEVFD